MSSNWDVSNQRSRRRTERVVVDFDDASTLMASAAERKVHSASEPLSETYGECTIGSVARILDMLGNLSAFVQENYQGRLAVPYDAKFDLGRDSKFLDVGSGFGKVVFHAKLARHVTESVGIECVSMRHNIADHIRQMAAAWEIPELLVDENAPTPPPRRTFTNPSTPIGSKASSAAASPAAVATDIHTLDSKSDSASAVESTLDGTQGGGEPRSNAGVADTLTAQPMDVDASASSDNGHSQAAGMQHPSEDSVPSAVATPMEIEPSAAAAAAAGRGGKARTVKSSKLPQPGVRSLLDTNGLLFWFGDATRYASLDYTHIYCFDKVFSPMLLQEMAKTLNRSDFYILVSYHAPEVWFSLGLFKIFPLGVCPMKSTGKEHFTAYIYLNVVAAKAALLRG
ncbi:hypothetical protein CAOG_01286 [Capsaspora owczarzaki ATCC 30864]|uniref:DOT1 domain-containing protein n=1 Tax=Capsaspora owczarzaki (strain ATCC 30864) TaxID=595528 RepID=A0A0D2VIQ7_CAPO3|nr:hypothetical protein CAOG_01286 [Capsaspora owczarzaki ATCC 30864]KJE89872.1 hypothetical protein CAOG_001286 [Capsaspora owczarzaki ATCC 30864]|eukprot:XP_004349806.1 hypothetical protein CAOG_01286 [Capsaspora owczarzaki ATCC 30864]